MKVLVACEFSGIVRDAFAERGHDAWSCDLLPSEKAGQHIQNDVLLMLNQGWDLMIAHPPCTHLAVSGARWFKNKEKEQEEALDFVRQLMNAPIPRICVENPISVISTRIRKPDQIIQPWMFGHGETKATCLWLKNLPKLKPTNIVDGREQHIWKTSPSPDRWKKRSRTFQGIADAMADQWSRDFNSFSMEKDLKLNFQSPRNKPENEKQARIGKIEISKNIVPFAKTRLNIRETGSENPTKNHDDLTNSYKHGCWRQHHLPYLLRWSCKPLTVNRL